jgi:hypothetical protein
MKIFQNTEIDRKGGYFESGIDYETLKKRIGKTLSLYAMSCGSPSPNNNLQEIIETVWWLNTYPGILKVGHWYTGIIGQKESVLSSDESCNILKLNIPTEFRSFMMLYGYENVTTERLELIQKYHEKMFPDKEIDLERIKFFHGPPRGYFLKDLLNYANENEAVATFICPVDSTKFGRVVKKHIRKNSGGWIVTNEKDTLSINISEEFEKVFNEFDLFQLQKILGITLNGKSTFRLLKNVIAENEGILIRDYSNSRGTLSEMNKYFCDQLIISKRIYVNNEEDKLLTNGFTTVSKKILRSMPLSKGDEIIFKF